MKINPAPVKFLIHIFDDSVEHTAVILGAQAENDKAIIKRYLAVVKEQIEEWTKELENDTN